MHLAKVSSNQPLKVTNRSGPLRNTVSFQAACCGQIAWDYLNESTQSSVMGITSRGIFLQIAPRRIVFFSTEGFRGPLTVNFPGFGGLEILNGDIAVVEPQRSVTFPSGLQFLLLGAPTWQANLPEPSLNEPEILIERVKKCARLALVEKQGAGLSSLLAPILNLNIPVEGSDAGMQILPSLLAAKKEIQAGRYGNISTILAALLGRGVGLTPSGDDLIIGILLAFNRFPQLFQQGDSIKVLNQSFIQLAYSRTTILSANLIESATRYQADERLISGLDDLVTGTPAPEECAALLGSWGNSSGVDALVGFSLAMTSIQQTRSFS